MALFAADEHDRGTYRMETPPMPLIAALILLVPLIALAIAVVDTRRANARTGVPAVELTYRAYGA